MGIRAVKSLAGVLGGAAIVAAATVCLLDSAAAKSNDVAGGSGDSATTTVYTQPVLPAMSIGQIASAAATPTTETAASTLATSDASPTYKAAPPSGF